MNTSAPTHPPRRRILLAVIGMSPQVITETVYALAMRPASEGGPWIPDQIVAMTTSEGAENTRRSLLSQDLNWFKRLCDDYQLGAIHFNASSIRVILDEHGEAATDIRTVDDAERAADQIANLVREFTAKDDTELHVSIAGGRKTMGYYLGYALSLFGREQDRLSHVLVSEDFENNAKFFYPTPYPCTIEAGYKRPNIFLDCRDADVTLTPIPFVRLRDGLSQRLLNGDCGFIEAVHAANRVQMPANLKLFVKNRKIYVVADDEPIRMANKDAIYLYFLAQRTIAQDPAFNPSNLEHLQAFHRFLEDPRKVFSVDQRLPNSVGELHAELSKALALLKQHDSADHRAAVNRRRAEAQTYFEPYKSSLGKAFRAALTEKAAARYAPLGGSSFAILPLEPKQIEIIPTLRSQQT